MMSLVLILIISNLLGTIAIPSLTGPSYGELALQNVAKSFVDAVGALPILNDTAQPDSVKPMRKSLLLARNGLDVFVFAYPGADLANKKPRQGDVFSYLRDDLDVGYTLVGNFQDLSVVNKSGNYSREDYLQRLGACLSWKKNFTIDIEKFAYKAYVLSASTTKFFPRKPHALSRDYWGNVSARPQKNLTGYQNIAILADGQLNNSVNFYDFVINLTDIWDPGYHDQFHDYRKLLRAIFFVGTTYLPIYQSNVTVRMPLVDDAYGKFGKLNDLCITYAYYVSKGNNEKAAEIKQQIIASWATLTQWMRAKSFKENLVALQSLLIPHSMQRLK